MAKKKNKKASSKGETAVKRKRRLDFDLNHGAFGYPHVPIAMREDW